MVDVSLDESVLLLWRRVPGVVARMRSDGVVVVVSPLAKVVGELETRCVSCCVLEIDNDELLVLVCGLEQR